MLAAENRSCFLQTLFKLANVEFTRRSARRRAQCRRSSRGLSHSHALSHGPHAGVSIVGRREAAASYQQIFHFLRNERTKRNADAFSIGKVLPFGIATSVVIFDRRSAESDLVVELSRAEHIFACKTVFAMALAASRGRRFAFRMRSVQIQRIREFPF